MKKTVGIITLQGNNYGATLQAVALNYIINILGYNAVNIDYNDVNRVGRGMTRQAKTKNIIWKYIQKLMFGGYRKEKAFSVFRAKNLLMTEKKWHDAQELSENPPLFDIYVSGSDQIWNPDVINGDYHYLLSFAGDDAKKISYASSFGKAMIPEKQKKAYGRYLSRYDAIGVREKSGQAIIKEILNRDVQIVLDPTLLLDKDQWMQMAADKLEDEKIILCYYMPGDKTVNKAIECISNELAKTTGLEIVNLGLKEYYCLKPGMDCRMTAGPAEFLRLFSQAEYVVTNSFHGTAFATNFGNKLCVPINGNIDQKKARHTRIVEYLDLIGYSSAVCMIYGNELVMPEIAEMSPQSRKRLLQLRKESLSYLKDALD